jgi:outer membrane protein OmpA-like peptidoglycan-associated protein
VLDEFKLVKTNKGCHLYGKYNPDLKTGTNVFEKYPKVDIRNDDSIVFAPPTKYTLLDGTVVQYEDKGGAILDFPTEIVQLQKHVVKKKKEEVKQKKKDDKQKKDESLTNLEDICKQIIEKGLLDHKCENYDDWTKVGFAIFNSIRNFELFDLFSQRLPSSYDADGVLKFWNASFSNKVYATDINIPEASARYGIIIGAGIPLDFYGYQITPEISYRKSIINNISSVLSTWNVDQIRIGFAIKLGPNETEPEIIPAPKIGIESIGSYEDGGAYKKLDINGIRVEDIQYTELFPFIPYIFFKANSDKPDETIQYMNAGDARGKFTLEALPQDAIEINKRTLDIIGTRMIDNPEATLMCIGTTDGKTEAKNKGLGLRRAQYAKTYLTSNFAIAADRIGTETRNVPENPSALNIEDGMVENRRVDFKSNSSEILQPIMIKGDGTRIAKPEMLEFRPIEVPDSTISSWTLSISQAGRTLREYVGIGSPTAQRWVIRPNELSNSQVPIDYTLTAMNSAGGKADTSGSIPVEYRASLMNSVETRADMTVSKFSLILFDFDKSDIPEENIAILKKFVAPAIKGNSKVKIFGYTDKIGPDLYNKTLSTDRANAVRDILQTQIPDAMYEAFGRGEDVPIFDNDIATGRLLSRTVQIYVETPR